MRKRVIVLLLCLPMLALAQDRVPEVRHQELRFELSAELAKSAVVTSEVTTVPPVLFDRAEPFLAVGAAWSARGEIQLSADSDDRER